MLPGLDEFHGKGTAEATDCETALSDGEEYRTGGGRCVGAYFGGIVYEVAGNRNCCCSQQIYIGRIEAEHLH